MTSQKHIIVVHGFLLSGTGSNIYSCNLASQWKKQGYAITVYCQDPDAGGYDWVDEYYTHKDELPKTAPLPGKVRVIVPDIAGLLPVYNYDDYKGYTVKTIYNCTDEEIDRHVSMMAKAIGDGVRMWGCDKVLANHALLQPLNVKRALEETNIPFDIKIHGSSILFVLDKYPKYKPLAIEAINACNKIIAGTQHVVQQITDCFPDLDLSSKLVIIPPGMDPDVFDLCTSIEDNTNRFLTQCEKHISKEGNGYTSDIKVPDNGVCGDAFHQTLNTISKTYNQRVVDADISKRFPKIAQDEPVLIFFGKFLYTKGIGEILLCFANLIKKKPKLRLILVGFGNYREHLEVMLKAFVSGDKELYKAAAFSKDEKGDSFLESSIDVDKYFLKLSAEEADRVLITGCLNHKELGLILPIASISLVTSKATEAFGMVSVEALSAGVLPLCVYHSGIKDVLDKLKETEPELESIMHMSVKPGGDFNAANGADLMEVLPTKLCAALDYLYPPQLSAVEQIARRKEVAKKLRTVAEDTWSWDGICKSLAAL